MLIFAGIIGLLAGVAGALITLAIQYRRLDKPDTQQEAWERAQQGHLRTWEAQQEKRLTDLEAQLAKQLQDLQQAWQTGSQNDIARLEALAQEYKTAITRLNLEHELARVPHVEDIPLAMDSHGQSLPTLASWRPSIFNEADLRKQDLSHRYLGYAELRGAQLADATLFMANLSGANLSGADLSNANLAGADLSGADLSNATLSGANLLVADLHNAVLRGANLLGARNLTPQQVRSTIYDSTTQFDFEIDSAPTPVQKSARRTNSDETSPRIGAIGSAALPVPATPASIQQAIPATPAPMAEATTNATPEPQVELHLVAQDVSTPVEEPAVAASATSAVPETPHPGTSTAASKVAVPVEASGTAPEQGMESELLSSTLLPDMTSFIEHLSEPASSSPLSADESLLDPKVADLLLDTQESKRTEKARTASPNRGNSSKRAAQAD